MECPRCGRKNVPLYRNRPKGVRAEFVCEWCLLDFPSAPIPNKEVLEVTKALSSEPTPTGE